MQKMINEGNPHFYFRKIDETSFAFDAEGSTDTLKLGSKTLQHLDVLVWQEDLPETDDEFKAYLANERIYSSFDIDVNTGIYICPDDFAGTAIDGINGQTFLRLYLKQPDETAKARWLELAGNNASVVQIQEVKYSYNELQQMVDELSAELKKKGCPILAWSVNVMNNGFNFATTNEYMETVKNEICAKYPDIPLNLEYSDEGPEATDLRQLLSNKTFVWEKPGAGGKFHISLAEDGHFGYYEGMFSSFIGMGDWSLDGSILTLTMDARLPAKRFRFTAWQNELFFIADGSDRFTYVNVMDGDRFILSDEFIPVEELKPGESEPAESTAPETEPAETQPAEPVSSSEIYTFADGEIFDYIGEWEGKKYFLISFLLSADGLSEVELGQGLNMTAVGVAEASKNGGEIQVLTELGRYI